MLDLKAALLERYSPFHLTSLRARFRFPNVYYASSISDFVENRDKVQPTPDGLFQWSGNKGNAAIMLYNCDYQCKKPRKRESRLGRMDLSFLCLSRELREISGQDTGAIQQEIDAMLGTYHNAAITDMGGELALQSPAGITFPDGARLYKVWLGYEPRSGLTWIVHADTHGPSVGDRSVDVIIAESAGMVPRFSPA